jgi:hypothetical protein
MYIHTYIHSRTLYLFLPGLCMLGGRGSSTLLAILTHRDTVYTCVYMCVHVWVGGCVWRQRTSTGGRDGAPAIQVAQAPRCAAEAGHTGTVHKRARHTRVPVGIVITRQCGARRYCATSQRVSACACVRARARARETVAYAHTCVCMCVSMRVCVCVYACV